MLGLPALCSEPGDIVGCFANRNDIRSYVSVLLCCTRIVIGAMLALVIRYSMICIFLKSQSGFRYWQSAGRDRGETSGWLIGRDSQ